MWLILLFNNLAWLNIVIACQHNFWEKDAPDIAFYVFFAGIICGLAAIWCLCDYLDEQEKKAKKTGSCKKCTHKKSKSKKQ